MDERSPAGIPSRIGGFSVLRLLGEGGMGRVFLAHDPRLDRRLAIKVLPERLWRDPEWLRRLQTEARILASLNHPNIATIYDLIEDEDGQTALILEFIEGESLAQRLHGRPLPLEETISICRQIAQALEATHERGLLHLDLKPGNVMVTPKGHVKLLDFGLARSAHEPGRASSTLPLGGKEKGEQGRGSGTPGYMSPEQIRGMPLERATDIFGFGCILFECLTGKRAFAGKTTGSVLASTLEKPPPWEALPTSIPAGIRSLLARCLEPDASSRIQEIAQVRAEMEGTATPASAPAGEPGEPAERPSNLPMYFTSFVGREGDLRECAAFLASSRLLTLTGPGGCGKTRLAQALAIEVASRFPHGIHWIDLASLNDPARVTNAVAAALGVQEEPTIPLQESMIRHLKQRTTLLLLDNCEHLLSACGQLANALLRGAPQVRILATSREHLSVPGEQEFPVASLPSPEAPAKLREKDLLRFDSVHLFLERARLVQPEWIPSVEEVRIVAEVCRRLDGLPLAIELAAARLRVLSVEQIVQRLDQRFRLLSGRAPDGPSRHRTLQATLDWSYGLLDSEEQRFLRNVSTFAGGWTLAAATSICTETQDEFAALDLHARLVDKSLIVVTHGPDETRYRLLETIRQYARERFDQEGESAAVLDRYLDFYVTLVDRARPLLQGPRQASWLRLLETEHENILVALEWAGQDDAHVSKGLRIIGSLSLFWEGRGHLTLGRAAARRLLACGEPRPTPERARALSCAGNLAWEQSDYTEASRCYGEALDISRALDDRNGVARALGSLGLVAFYQGDLETAKGFFEETLARFRELGDRLGTAKTLGNLGTVVRNLGDHETARRLHLENLAMCRELGNLRSAGIATYNLAVISLEVRDYDSARAHIRESIEISRDLDDPYQTAANLERVSELLAGLRRTRMAVRFRAAAGAIRETIGAPVPPGAQSELRDFLDAAHAALSEEEFAKEWQAGRALPAEAAASEALDILGAGRLDAGTVPPTP